MTETSVKKVSGRIAIKRVVGLSSKTEIQAETEDCVAFNKPGDKIVFKGYATEST